MKYIAHEVEITCTYKREAGGLVTVDCNIEPHYIMLILIEYEEYLHSHVTVSYTHLTLPTILLV